MTDMWIECLKNKYRFEFKGLISAEDLFEDNPKQLEVEAKINIVKEIFNMKQAEIEANKRALANKAQKAKILAIIENKQDQELSEKSIEELKEIYDNLE